MALISSVRYSRSALRVATSVWRALFLREAISRLSTSRTAWLWLLLEPIAHMSYLLVIFTVVRVSVVGGVNTGMWLLMGLIGFFMFRRTAVQSQHAINANKALFTYRQVKPVDTVMVRAALEGLLLLVAASLLLLFYALLGKTDLPSDPLRVVLSLFGLWLIGLGFGLIASVATALIHSLEKVFELIMMPLYFLSGVLVHTASVPQPFRGWLLLNPITHGVESARLGYAPAYNASSGNSMAYLYGCAIVLIFIGLALHRQFARRLMMQ